ncbi:MAG TPA: TPM domain-containing protein [Nitrospirota bacterium]|nr:TPM domain-containing protein [Nitrospirota bacterium]
MNFVFKKLVLCAILVICLFTSPAAAVTPEPPAVPQDYVVDLAGIIRDDVRNQLDAYLSELERKTTAQVLVLTIQSLDGEDIEGFSLRTAEKWKLGQKGKDNGLLIVVAVKDKKYRLEVGYGLESVLPDSLVGSIGREYLVPYFRRGDFSTGIFTATLAVIQAIASHEGVQITGVPGTRRIHEDRVQKPVGIFGTISLIVLFLIAVVLFVTNPRQCLLLFFASSLGSRGRGWYGGGYGGFGGGSSGGFGGGGGGGFGGGGASGGW